MTDPKPIDVESAAIAALATAILRRDPSLLGRRVEFEFRTIENGAAIELWADGRRYGIIPASAIAAVTEEVRRGRN